MTLREAIDQQINLGIKDPGEIAKKIGERFDGDWLASQLVESAEEIVRDMARNALSASRRASVSLTRVATLPKRDLMLEAAWLPGVGWVEFGRFTVELFDKLALQYRRGAAALTRYAEWCEANAALMREQGVAEFREVRGGLPQLPAAEAVA